MTSELEFQASFRPSGPVTVGDVLSRRLAMPDRGELAEAAAAKRREDSAVRQREELWQLNQVNGDPMGQVSRHQAMVSELRGEVADLESQLAAKHEQLTRAADNLIHWSDQAEAIRTAVARSGEPGDMLTDAKRALDEHRAEERVDALLAERRARPARAPRRERRPFVSRGSVTRSEHCVHCIDQGVSDEDSYLLHSDPELNVPVTTPQQAAAERSRSGHAVISR